VPHQQTDAGAIDSADLGHVKHHAGEFASTEAQLRVEGFHLIAHGDATFAVNDVDIA
jgi:hypothetical protein